MTKTYGKSILPSRHVTRRQARFGRLMASALAGTGACSASRRIKEDGRPRPLHGFGGKGRWYHAGCQRLSADFEHVLEAVDVPVAVQHFVDRIVGAYIEIVVPRNRTPHLMKHKIPGQGVQHMGKVKVRQAPNILTLPGDDNPTCTKISKGTKQLLFRSWQWLQQRTLHQSQHQSFQLSAERPTVQGTVGVPTR